MTNNNLLLNVAKELGRMPTQEEVSFLMIHYTKSHKKLNARTKENKILDSSLAIQKNKEEANKHRRKNIIQGNPRVRMVNKMLHHNLEAHQIADILDLQLKTIQDLIMKNKLPRDEIVLIPSKTGRRQI